MLIKSIDTAYNPKHIWCALVKVQPVINKVVPCYPTHKEGRTSLSPTKAIIGMITSPPSLFVTICSVEQYCRPTS